MSAGVDRGALASIIAGSLKRAVSRRRRFRQSALSNQLATTAARATTHKVALAFNRDLHLPCPSLQSPYRPSGRRFSPTRFIRRDAAALRPTFAASADKRYSLAVYSLWPSGNSISHLFHSAALCPGALKKGTRFPLSKKQLHHRLTLGYVRILASLGLCSKDGLFLGKNREIGLISFLMKTVALTCRHELMPVANTKISLKFCASWQIFPIASSFPLSIGQRLNLLSQWSWLRSGVLERLPSFVTHATYCAAVTMSANPALNLAPFSRWTLRDKAAQRRLALRVRRAWRVTS